MATERTTAWQRTVDWFSGGSEQVWLGLSILLIAGLALAAQSNADPSWVGWFMVAGLFGLGVLVVILAISARGRPSSALSPAGRCSSFARRRMQSGMSANDRWTVRHLAAVRRREAGPRRWLQVLTAVVVVWGVLLVWILNEGIGGQLLEPVPPATALVALLPFLFLGDQVQRDKDRHLDATLIERLPELCRSCAYALDRAVRDRCPECGCVANVAAVADPGSDAGSPADSAAAHR